MSFVGTQFSMSLDGYIALPDGSVGPLFDWYQAGDVTVTTANPGVTFHVSAADAAWIRSGFDRIGAIVTGRRLFDYTGGWGGMHPLGTPVVVLTHHPPADWQYPDAPFHFTQDGLPAAIDLARALAGDRGVAVAGPDLVRQCLDHGLLDEITINLVPVVLGEGIPYFGRLADLPLRLGQPSVVEGRGVTHLTYPVLR